MGIIDDVKQVAGLVQKIDNIELYRLILGLQAEVMGLVEENNRLNAKLTVQTSVSFYSNAYWLASIESQDGPFCPKCYDSDGKLIRMLIKAGDKYPQCTVCSLWIDPTQPPNLT